MNKKPSASFCILPWIHVSTKTNGEMRLCCTTSASSAGKYNDKIYGGKLGVNRNTNGLPANLSTSGLLEGWNNPYMRSVRQAMLRGERPVSCAKCFKEEAAGVISKRIWETEYWSKRIDIEELVRDTAADGSVPEKIYYLDLRFGHHCNLRCVMCSPHDSSSWIQDWKKIHPQIENTNLRGIMSWDQEGRAEGASYQWHTNPQFWEELFRQIPHMRQLYFAGGEPLLIKQHFELLRECVKQGHAKNITLRYNSNGTTLPEEVLELWNQFKQVRFGFSIDCVGDKNEYIRYPSRWDTVVKNLRRLDETGDTIEVSMACAVQVLNMYYLPEFIQWKLAQGFKKINTWPLGAGLVNLHFVYHPANLNVKVFPNAMKEKIAEKLDNFCSWLLQNYRSDDEFKNHAYGIKRLKNMVKFMYSEDWSNRLPEFQEYIRLIDKTRGTSFTKIFPEMAWLLDLRSGGSEYAGDTIQRSQPNEPQTLLS